MIETTSLAATTAEVRLTAAEEHALAQIMGFTHSSSGNMTPDAPGMARLQDRGYLAFNDAGKPVVDAWVATVLGTFGLARVTINLRVRTEGEPEQRLTCGRVGGLAVERVLEASGEAVYQAIAWPFAWLPRLLSLVNTASAPDAPDCPPMLMRRSRLVWARTLAISDGAAAAARTLMNDGVPAPTAEALASTLADARTQAGLTVTARRPESLPVRPIYGLTLLRSPGACWGVEELNPSVTHLFVQPVDAQSLSIRMAALIALAWSQ